MSREIPMKYIPDVETKEHFDEKQFRAPSYLGYARRTCTSALQQEIKDF